MSNEGYKDMVRIIEKLSTKDNAEGLRSLLRSTISVNKMLIKIEEKEQEMCNTGMGMFYTFAKCLDNDEINFCLEKINKKITRLED